MVYGAWFMAYVFWFRVQNLAIRDKGLGYLHHVRVQDQGVVDRVEGPLRGTLSSGGLRGALSVPELRLKENVPRVIYHQVY